MGGWGAVVAPPNWDQKVYFNSPLCPHVVSTSKTSNPQLLPGAYKAARCSPGVSMELNRTGSNQNSQKSGFSIRPTIDVGKIIYND